ncbi:MAG: histidinol dehydrogenase, partial [Fidelibacterota bacterium]
MRPVLPVITSPDQLKARLEARARSVVTDLADVHDILEQVREQGDRALRHFTQTYDGIDIEDPAVPQELLDQGREALTPELEQAIRDAAANIRRFHQRQRPEDFTFRQPDGTQVAWQWRPLSRVGVYIPGGRYPLLSTVLMTVVPAQVAGVAEIAVCTPPGPSGYPSDVLLGTCALLGLGEVCRVGGAQAIAALAFGTESIAAVDKIVGPGNRYVTAAKQAVSAQAGSDMLAGPTEVVILADESAKPRWVAAD